MSVQSRRKMRRPVALRDLPKLNPVRVREFAPSAPGLRGKSNILGRGSTVQAPTAALANGALAHAFELDSLTRPGAGAHRGATVLPPALAIAHESGADGRALIPDPLTVPPSQTDAGRDAEDGGVFAFDGRHLESRAEDRVLEPGELADKFQRLTRAAVEERDAGALYERLQQPELLPDCGPQPPTLVGSRSTAATCPGDRAYEGTYRSASGLAAARRQFWLSAPPSMPTSICCATSPNLRRSTAGAGPSSARDGSGDGEGEARTSGATRQPHYRQYRSGDHCWAAVVESSHGTAGEVAVIVDRTVAEEK